MKENKIPKFVADVTFKKFAQSVDERFEQVDQRFDRLEGKVDNIAIVVARHDVDIREIKTTTMTTQEIGREIIKQLADLSVRYEESQRAVRIHLNQLMEFRPVLDNHQKRLNFLEQNIPPKA